MGRVVLLEILGVLFIAATGTLLHYVYALSGNAFWVGIIAATSESVWEHLKLAFWPAALWTLVGWVLVGRSVQNFWVGRWAALTLMPIVIAVGFYAYISVIGHHALVFDLILFVLAIASGQLAALAIYQATPIGGLGRGLAIGAIVFECIIFGSLTFFPPDMPIFSGPI